VRSAKVDDISAEMRTVGGTKLTWRHAALSFTHSVGGGGGGGGRTWKSRSETGWFYVRVHGRGQSGKPSNRGHLYHHPGQTSATSFWPWP